MSKVRIELNSPGIRAFLRSAEMGELVGGRAADIAARCGDGYASDTKLMPGRVIASVFTDDARAAKDNADNNTILRSLL